MKKITLQKREQCVITGYSDLEHLYNFQKFPMFMGTTTQPPEEDLKPDMNFMISKKSGMIQLEKVIPQELLYAKVHNNSIGEMWKKHHKAFAAFLGKYHPKSVLEIGGGNGILEIYYQNNLGGGVPWRIIEPNPHPLPECHAVFEQGYVNSEYELPHTFDILVHSHVLEHIYDPMDFLESLQNQMEEDQCMVFSIPNLQKTLELKYTNALNFEHTYFITENYVDYLMGQYGFEIMEKELFQADHSIFYSVKKSKLRSRKRLEETFYAKNKKTFLDYITWHLDLVEQFNQKIERESRPVYLFGAHIFSQYLIAFGLHTDRIQGILDNDTSKQGQRLYGTHLMVFSPECLKGNGENVVILKVGNYASEIKEDILKKINPQIIFWE